MSATGEAVAGVIPLALAIAVSPFTIIPAILLLLTPRAAATSSSFLAGWLLGLAATATVFTLLSSLIEGFEESPAWVSWCRIALGVVLLVLAVRQWRQRSKPKPPPAWMQSISTLTPVKALRFAIVLAVANPKVLLLTVAAGLGIGAAELGAAGAAVAIAVFTLVAACSVGFPVLAYLIVGERMLAPLARARDWLERNNALVMSIVLVVIGVALLAKGIGDLT
jgi:threonine/homoserine/homoserine lactone efflux protein